VDLSALGDRYQLVRPIGRGTITMVLEAWDRAAGRRVALKVPIGPFAGDEAFLDRLQREVRAVAGFVHANVAAVHGIERDGRAALVVAELVDGSNLGDMLANRGPLPPVGAARVAAGVCAAVAAAHAQGITHGHLVPANVLLAIDGRVKVTDFRLALAGFPPGGIADPAADLRALGRCLAAMLTGQKPASAEPVGPGPTVPAELAALVVRAAGDRPDAGAYGSAAELGRDLARFLAATGAGGPPPRDPPLARAASPAPSAGSSPVSGRGSPHRPAAWASVRPAAGRPDPAPGDGAPTPTRRRWPFLRAGDDAPGRRRRLALRAGLVAAALVAGAALAAVAVADREPGGLTAGSAAAPPRTAVLQTTTGPLAGGRAASTTAPASTRPPTTAAEAAATTATTATREAGPGQRVVPDVVGLHRAQAADVLARAQLGMVIQEVPVPESGKAQRVVAQEPPAGAVVPARSDVLVLVAARRPAG
jgi:eukaryotic-like serine/threonine-protein kinase